MARPRFADFSNRDNVANGDITLDLETPGMAMCYPTWIGDDIHFVTPFVLKAVHADGTNRRDATSTTNWHPRATASRSP